MPEPIASPRWTDVTASIRTVVALAAALLEGNARLQQALADAVSPAEARGIALAATVDVMRVAPQETMQAWITNLSLLGEELDEAASERVAQLLDDAVDPLFQATKQMTAIAAGVSPFTAGTAEALYATVKTANAGLNRLAAWSRTALNTVERRSFQTSAVSSAQVLASTHEILGSFQEMLTQSPAGDHAEVLANMATVVGSEGVLQKIVEIAERGTPALAPHERTTLQQGAEAMRGALVAAQATLTPDGQTVAGVAAALEQISPLLAATDSLHGALIVTAQTLQLSPAVSALRKTHGETPSFGMPGGSM